MLETNYCYEVVTCRGRADMTREQVLSALGAAEAWLKQQPGFVERKLLEADDGSFVDFVTWLSEGHARVAAEGFTAAACAAQIMEALDEASVRILHARQIALA